MNIAKALTVQGWMAEVELRWLAEAASRSKRIVEIGSWAGRSATCLGAHTQGTVHCVDSWERSLTHQGNPLDPTLFNEFLANTKGLPVIPVPTLSVTAAQWFKLSGMTFDMIFIDADHQEPQVRADITAWRPLLAEGGVFCGHDFGFLGWPDVEKVVREMIPKFHVIETIWVMD